MIQKTMIVCMGLLTTIPTYATEKPNIIFILADDMGSADLGFLGSGIKTPNLDRLRSEGMYLTRSYVQPQSTPTRTALLTGCYPYRYGLHEHIVINSSDLGLPNEVKTIAEKMQEGGYATAMVGKWHQGARKRSYLPDKQGFDKTFIGIEGTLNYWNYSSQGEKFDLVENGEKYYPKSRQSGEKSGNVYSTELFGDKAEDILKQHDKKNPLFMYLAFTSPHHPLMAPQKIRDVYKDFPVDDYWAGEDAKLRRKRETRITYMAMVDAMDRAIGGLLETLKREKMYDNTLLVFCSDNGGIIEADNRPLRSNKGDSYEGGIRSTTLVWYPGRVESNSTSDELIYIADWYPTFAEIAGMDCKAEDLDGVSALRIMEGGKSKRDAIPIISSARHAYITPNYSLVGVGGDYQKIVTNDFANFRLYDLQNDVGQQYPIEDKSVLKSSLKDDFRPFFSKIQRGNFNWDVRYCGYRGRDQSNKGDHGLDYCLNDMPEVVVSSDAVKVSPVLDEFVYILKGVDQVGNEEEVDRFVCRESASSYQFKKQKKYSSYRVEVDFHHGIPIYEGFDIGNHYSKGALFTQTGTVKAKKLLPQFSGFLSFTDAARMENISIVDGNLNVTAKDNSRGMLCLSKRSNSELQTSLTRYFIEPFSKGKLYVSMLVRLDSDKMECAGKINWLQLNDTKTKTCHSLSIETDGVYGDDSTRLCSNQAGDVIRLLYVFDLASTNQDELTIYINPVVGKLEPNVVVQGEFTFDRLQFMVDGRESAKLYIDDIHISNRIEDVL